MAEGARLESVYTATYRGFESPPHRHYCFKINNLQRNNGFVLHKILHKEARLNGLFLYLNSLLLLHFSFIKALFYP